MPTQGLQQSQKQTRTLLLTPQLRQSLKILQVPLLDLRSTILEAIQSNPLLEESPGEENRLEGDEKTESPSEEEPTREEVDFDEGWSEYFAQENQDNTSPSEATERHQHLLDSLTSETSLQEYLIRQAKLTQASPQVLQAFEYLIGSLDERGFINAPLTELAHLSNLPLSILEESHQLLKTLDPPGIGSTHLQECLLTQLELKGKANSLATAIIREHFDLLLRRRIPKIAHELGVGLHQVEAAVEAIAALDPAPGRKYEEGNNRIIIPDVKVEKENGQWTIMLNNEYIPRLHLSNTYKKLIARGNLSPKEKDYIQEKIRAGKFIINAIEQRQQTIENITREILIFQRDFFEHGAAKLRPLTMQQVADALEIHETTVSRAVAHKYLETPHGVFEFKYFFTSGYTLDREQAIANTTIKELIAKLIESENPKKPYSDQAIVRQLSQRGIKIARRTVAKYREAKGIPPTNLRRRYE